MRACALALLLLALPAAANDGPAVAVPAGGIVFQRTDAIAMESESLRIAEDRVDVAYEFRNLTDNDVTLTVAFPLPVYRIFEFEDAPPRYGDFTVRVNGAETRFATSEEAVLCGDPVRISPAPARGPLAESKNLTALLREHGVPIADYEALFTALDAMSAETKRALAEAGAVTLDGDSAYPQWCVKIVYHWEQTFPANATTRIEHSYSPQAAMFNEWHLEPFFSTQFAEGRLDDIPPFGSEAFNAACGDFLKAFDIDESIQKWAAAQRAEGRRFGFVAVDYILTTGALWSGPIKRFTLTIEKPEPYAPAAPGGPTEGIVVSTDFPGLEKTGDRTFSVTRENFTPEKDVSVLFIHAYPPL